MDGEHVHLADFAVIFDKEDLFGDLVVHQVFNAIVIKVEALYRGHLNGAVQVVVVVVFNPVPGQLVELLQ